jgi:hypothetical protein
MLARRVLSLLAALISTPGFLLAADIHVDVANTGIEDGTPANPFNTIQEGINAGSVGDRVLVAPGTYPERVVMADGVHVQGSGRDDTIIDASGLAASAVTFSGTRFNPRLNGFTITGGEGELNGDIGGTPIRAGGGVLILEGEGSVTGNRIAGNTVDDGICLGGGVYVNVTGLVVRITDNVIENNTALSTTVSDNGRGGGVYLSAKNATIVFSDNRIEGNVAFEGGGVYVDSTGASTAVVTRNVIRSGQATFGAGIWARAGETSENRLWNNLVVGNGSSGVSTRGGGLLAVAGGAGTFSILNNTFVDNDLAAGIGGALSVDDLLSGGSSKVANNIFADNDATQGGGIDHTSFSGTIQYNDFHNNGGGDLHDGGASGAFISDNLFLAPQLVSPSVENYRLGSSSPCIDAGDDLSAPPDDLDGFVRPFDGDGVGPATADIGAYEYPSGEVFGLAFVGQDVVNWQGSPLQATYNLYRGSLARLLVEAEYTQDPLEEPMANRFCGLLSQDLPFSDPHVPPTGTVVFYVVTVSLNGWEGTLGTDSTGLTRSNDAPCSF